MADRFNKVSLRGATGGGRKKSGGDEKIKMDGSFFHNSRGGEGGGLKGRTTAKGKRGKRGRKLE